MPVPAMHAARPLPPLTGLKEGPKKGKTSAPNHSPTRLTLKGIPVFATYGRGGEAEGEPSSGSHVNKHLYRFSSIYIIKYYDSTVYYRTHLDICE